MSKRFLLPLQASSSEPDPQRKEPMPDSILSIRFRLWLETPSGVAFGPGRAMLLSKIDQTGSLNQAASELGISYRAAWESSRNPRRSWAFPCATRPGAGGDTP